MSSKKVLEIRTLRIHHGQRDAYHDYLMRNDIARMYEAQGIRIIHYGPSLHDEDSYFVIRSHPSISERAENLDNIYSSPDWLMNHEEKVLEMIESMNTAVFEADDRLIDALKESFQPGKGAVLEKEPK